MTVIQDRDVVESVADALQFISYYHPQDFVQAVRLKRIKKRLNALHGLNE